MNYYPPGAINTVQSFRFTGLTEPRNANTLVCILSNKSEKNKRTRVFVLHKT